MRKEIIRTSQGEIAFNNQSGTKEESRLLGLLMVPRTIDEIYNLLGEECEPLISSLTRRGWVKYNNKSINENEKPKDMENEDPLVRLRKKMQLASLNKVDKSEEVLDIDLEDENFSSFSKEDKNIPNTIVTSSHETGIAAQNIKRPHVSKAQVEKSINEFFDLFNLTPPESD